MMNGKYEFMRKRVFLCTAIVVVLITLAQSGLGGALHTLASRAYENLAGIASLNAAVPINEYNGLAAQFAQKEGELSLREQALLERERNLTKDYETAIEANKRLTLYVLGAVTLALLTLILFNFYLDMKREDEHEISASHDHRGELTTRL